MPTNDADLETLYSTQDYTDVGTSNNVRVSQTGLLEFMVHQFKDFTGGHTTVKLHCECQVSQAPSFSTVYLQVYNQTTTTWETLTTDNSSSASTDFVIEGNVNSLSDYQNAQGVTSSRVYQEAK